MPEPRQLPTFSDQVKRLSPALVALVAAALSVWALPSRSQLGQATTAAGPVPALSPSAGPSATGSDGAGAGTMAAGPDVTTSAGRTVGARVATAGHQHAPSSSCVQPPNVYVDTVPGHACAPKNLDCRRNQVMSGSTCRPPAYSGAKLSGNWPGVSPTKVTVVYYSPKQNAQVQAILQQAGNATDADRQVAMKAVSTWLEQHFELYGRTLDLHYIVGNSPASDDAGEQQDAVSVATTYEPLIVLSEYAGPAFYDELHRRNVMAYTWYQFSSSYFASHSPDLFGLFQDRDLTLDYEAEYICKRVAGRDATHAGDPTMQNKKRVFGIIAQQNFSNDTFLKEALKRRCGVQVAKTVEYPGDISQSVTNATNAIVQLKQAGVTTVACICDVIAPIFFTEQATNQGWFPEWLQNGYYVTDSVTAGRLYDQSQWSHSFGTSTLAFPTPLADTPGYRVCLAGGGSAHSCRLGQSAVFAGLLALVSALEQVGPDPVTPSTMAQLFYNLPPIGHTHPNDPRGSFGNQGPGPYTLLDDVMEVWWDENGTGTDGNKGRMWYVASGRRYLAGQLPATDPRVFVDDGSPQPKRDPDANS